MKTADQKAQILLDSLKRAIRDINKLQILNIISPEPDMIKNYPDWEKVSPQLADEYNDLVDDGLDLIL